MEGGRRRDDPDVDGLTAIDRQHALFLANREIKAVALIPLKGLLEAVRKGEKEVPAPPVYSSVGADGREWLFGSRDCARIEEARQACCELCSSEHSSHTWHSDGFGTSTTSACAACSASEVATEMAVAKQST